MTINRLILALTIAAVGVVAARFIPVNAEPFHRSPEQLDQRFSEVRLIGQGAPIFQARPEDALAEFERIAINDARTHLVRGSVAEGMMTFVSRSRVFGFRDFTTVKAVQDGESVRLEIFARPRGNVYDWGVNAKRLGRWLSKLEKTFPRS